MLTLLLCAALQEAAASQAPITTPALDAAELAAHIEVLASDEFAGRGPGQIGEEKTVPYLIERLKASGLEPAGTDGGWTQAVPMQELTPVQPPTASYDAGFGKTDLVFGRDAMVWSPRSGEPIAVQDSPVVFAGYGIVAPEYGWNDYAGIDAKGKTVVVLVNDPGFTTGDPEVFRGNAMTYYGRWTYKFEEAARQGASACLIVHETGPAGYPWTVVVQSWGRGQLYLAERGAGPEPTPIQGWVTADAAKKMLGDSWLSFDALAERARAKDAGPVETKLSFTSYVENASRDLLSSNVAAKITGALRPEEAVLITAHWDHLGVREVSDGEDGIYNGALDNATGTAGLLELAEAMAAGSPPERTVLFLAVTAEEKGLLGSAHYAANPLFPLSKTVCGLNIDGLNLDGPMRDIAIVGMGASELDKDVHTAALAQGRIVVNEASPEKGYYFRSDHFSLAKVGVPMMYTDSGTISVEHGSDWVMERRADYLANRYHREGDEYDASWDLSGALEDLRVFHALLAGWSNSRYWPEWSPDSEFRAAREASLGR